MNRRVVVSTLSAAVAVLTTIAQAETAGVWFYSGGTLTYVQRDASSGEKTAEAVLQALAAGPTAEERAAGIYSALPMGTSIHSVLSDGTAVTVALSREVLAGLSEVGLQQIYRQVRWTLRPFGLDSDIRLTVEDRLLSDYLSPAQVVPASTLIAPPPNLTRLNSLAGRSITLSPGHGYMWNGSSWVTQRPVYCSPLNQEDFHNLEMCQYLETYLKADGMTVRLVRCTDKNFGNHSSGRPWWQMAAYVWLKQIGYPCSVYANSSGDCNLGSGGSESSDDIRSRPLASDQDGSDIYVSLHTNGFTGDCTGSCPTGSETYYDASTEHAAWGAVSQTLATHINSNLMSAITANVDSSWTCHGTCVKNSNGNYGEIRIPDRAATLTELAFHDTCDRDAVHLRDNFFRSAAMWGMYKGICQYFGTTPAWDFYSDELVSDTIPTNMTSGQLYDVSVTFRNRGVLWTEARSIRLGAVNDSDPFTPFTRVNLSGEVGPGATYTFNFQMTAPAAGDYVSDWRMVREGVTWFGATLTRNIHVAPNIVDNEPPTRPTDLTATAVSATSVQLDWTASTDNFGVAGYDIRRNGNTIGSSPTNSYTDNTASPATTYSYTVRARDAVPNYSAYSDPAVITTPPAPTVVFMDGFNGGLSEWTLVAGKEFAYSTTQNHGTYTGNGAAYMAALESDQMYHPFTRPFAGGRISGYFYDQYGGYKTGTCGTGYRQSLSLRDNLTAVGFIIDNCFAQNVGNANYYWRTVGDGGITYTAYAARNPGTSCAGAWIYFETAVTPGVPGAAPAGTFVAKVTDGAGTTTTTQNLTNDFESFGIGRITLGLGVSSNGEGYWDDIAFEATPPGAPSMGVPTAIGANQVTWPFAPADNNLFGFDVADAGGSILSPAYGGAGWLTRSATSWTETGLAPNTSYTRKTRAWNGTLDGPYSSSKSAWTLSAPPAADSITPNLSAICYGGSIVWTAVGGFGPGRVQYYRYAWDQNSTYAFTGAEPQWSAGTLTLVPDAVGTWYLHVQGYNGADVPNGSYSYSVSADTTIIITSPPVSKNVCIGSTASFAFTTIAGGGPLSYQWFMNGDPLNDGGRISGATGPVLQIIDIVPADAGNYSCTVTNGCDSQTTESAVLTAVPDVPPDFDVDCDVDQADVDHLQACATGPMVGPLSPGCENVDLDQDGDVDQSDFGLLQRCIGGSGAAPDPACWTP